MIGYVYKITGGDKCYIGSTELSLEERFKQHQKDYRCHIKTGTRTSNTKLLFEEFGIDNCHIELLEVVEFEELVELVIRETHYFDIIPNVNKNRPYVSPEERKRCQKKWRENNKDHCKEYGKKYRSDNKEQCQKISKEYY